MCLAPWMVALLLLTSGSGSRDPTLIINNHQSLVMDPSVLSVDITAATPSLTIDRGRLRAYNILSNDHPAPGHCVLPFLLVRCVGIGHYTVRHDVHADRAPWR